MKATKLAGSLLLLLAWGCTTSRITHSWKTDQVPAKKYNNILVLALNGETEMDTRQRMETHMADDLKGLGYNAVSSMQEYGPKAFRDMKEEAVIEKIQNKGFDAVLTIVLLDKEKERQYVPGRIYYSPYAIYYRHFYGYYTTIYNRVYTPGYYTTSTRYFWESNLYDLASKELLYSAQTESFDPASSETLAHEYGKMIVKDMVKSHVLMKPEEVVPM